MLPIASSYFSIGTGYQERIFCGGGEKDSIDERETRREEVRGQASERRGVVLIETVLEARRHIELGAWNF